MFWNKKGEDKKGLLPELPPMNVSIHRPEIQSVRSFPAPPEEDENTTGNKLPAFPESAAHDKFSQVIIKEAVRDEAMPAFPSENNKTFKRSVEEAEEEEWAPAIEPEEHEVPEAKSSYKRLDEPARIVREERKEIFVKLDKFRSAKKALGAISKNIEEMETLIRKIRETKMREDQEFTNWESNVESLKARIENVREDIFERI